MKVKLVNDNWDRDKKEWAEGYGVVFPERNKVYTVRSVEHWSGGDGYLLEEIINPSLRFNTGKVLEPIFSIERFHILLPNDIEEMINEKKKTIMNI